MLHLGGATGAQAVAAVVKADETDGYLPDLPAGPHEDLRGLDLAEPSGDKGVNC